MVIGRGAMQASCRAACLSLVAMLSTRVPWTIHRTSCGHPNTTQIHAHSHLLTILTILASMWTSMHTSFLHYVSLFNYPTSVNSPIMIFTYIL